MNHSEVDTAITILVRQGYQDLAFRLAVLVESEKYSRKAELDLETQNKITSQDRDNRRRRMDIAMVVLDESQTIDLEAIAAILWPEGNPLAGAIQSVETPVNTRTRVPGFDYCRHEGCHNGANVGGNGYCGVHFYEGQPVAIDDISKPTVAVPLDNPGPHKVRCDGNHSSPLCSDPDCWLRCINTTVCAHSDNPAFPECTGPIRCLHEQDHKGLHGNGSHEW